MFSHPEAWWARTFLQPMQTTGTAHLFGAEGELSLEAAPDNNKSSPRKAAGGKSSSINKTQSCSPFLSTFTCEPSQCPCRLSAEKLTQHDEHLWRKQTLRQHTSRCPQMLPVNRK
ncbi:hypothetical protein E2C01_072306 [Portunus trituberculatus]|uniref:Uncharacterized protein n=1 Tax=Portunus trituberculatus TaxID=210409 RepID=A0A5B7IAD7_PORTR|nr:hypothetical protein [Portunus trituberculatus]